MSQKKKSQAEQAVTAARSKANKDKSKDQVKKDGKENKQERTMPVRVISSIALAAAFLLSLVLFLTNGGGALTRFITNIIYGLIGQIGFAISIPVLLYLFVIHAFSGSRPIKMRTISLCAFVLICGCIAHLMIAPDDIGSGISMIGQLYSQGANGTTSGLICGGIAMLLEWLCGAVISYIILFIAALLTLLGGMQITIPSIVRAIQDRPRDESEKETLWYHRLV